MDSKNSHPSVLKSQAETTRLDERMGDRSSSQDFALEYVAREYHELMDRPVVEKSQIELLSENVSRLENLILRLAFVSKENRYILKKDNF